MTKHHKAAIENAKPAPRTLAELQEAYRVLASYLGNLDYQRRCLAAECDRLSQTMFNVNAEAAERQKLDADKAPATGVDTKSEAPLHMDVFGVEIKDD